MKYFFSILVCILPLISLAQPVSVRVKNNSKLFITKIELTNSHGEDFTFTNIKAGKVSAYKKLNSLCSCGYQVKIWYKNKTVKNSNCTNVMECKDFFHGKLLMKIDAKFRGDDADLQLTFKKG